MSHKSIVCSDDENIYFYTLYKYEPLIENTITMQVEIKSTNESEAYNRALSVMRKYGMTAIKFNGKEASTI